MYRQKDNVGNEREANICINEFSAYYPSKLAYAFAKIRFCLESDKHRYDTPWHIHQNEAVYAQETYHEVFNGVFFIISVFIAARIDVESGSYYWRNQFLWRVLTS